MPLYNFVSANLRSWGKLSNVSYIQLNILCWKSCVIPLIKMHTSKVFIQGKVNDSNWNSGMCTIKFLFNEHTNETLKNILTNYSSVQITVCRFRTDIVLKIVYKYKNRDITYIGIGNRWQQNKLISWPIGWKTWRSFMCHLPLGYFVI